MDQLIIGITHADGLAGEAVLKAMALIEVEKESIRLYSSTASAGNRLAYEDSYIVTLDQQEADFAQCGLLLQLEKDDVLSEKIEKSGVLLVKQGGDLCFFNQQDDLEVQLDYSQTTFNVVDAEAYLILKMLNAIRQSAEVESAQVTLLRPASFLGKAGVDELAKQTIDLLNARSVETSVFPAQQAFNLFTLDSANTDSANLVSQIKSNLDEDTQSIQCQTMQVPVFYGTTFMFSVQANMVLSENLLKQYFAELNAVQVVDSTGDVVSPVTSLQEGSIATISQLRVDEENPQNVQFVLTADYLSHGLAELFLNAMLVIRKTFL